MTVSLAENLEETFNSKSSPAIRTIPGTKTGMKTSASLRALTALE